MKLHENDFVQVRESIRVEFPQAGLKNFSVYRQGYEEESDFQDYRRHYIYDLKNFEGLDYVDLPIIPGLDLYTTHIAYRKDAVRYSFESFGNNIDVSIPEWTLDYIEFEDSIQIISQNEADYYSLNIHKSHQDDNAVRKVFQWSYRFDASRFDLIVPLLSLPMELLEELNDDFFSPTSGTPLMTLGLVERNDFDRYEAYLQWRLGSIPDMARRRPTSRSLLRIVEE